MVQFKQYHGRAGHYIVIDGQRTGVDYTYMHLRQAALVDEGDRVRTGQLIGYVGTAATPAAATCTSRCGRPRAGTTAVSPIDPLPSLRGLGQDVLTA